MGIGGSVLSILTLLLANRSQHVMVDGCLNKVPQGRVLGQLLFLLYTWSWLENPFWKNKLIGYADDSTLTAVVPLCSGRVPDP